MIEHGLGEGLSTSAGAEVGGETKGLVDGEVSLDVEQRSAGALLFAKHVTTAASEHTVDSTHGLLGNLDLDEVDGLEEGGVGEEGGGVEHTTSGGDDLSTTTMDGIGVEGDIHDVEADGTHGLLGNGTLAGGPLETRDDRVLDFAQVLDSLGLINQQVGAVGVGAEAPDLAGIGDVPAIFVGEDTGADLDIVTGTNLAGLNGIGDLAVKRLSNDVDSVVLVGRLGEGGHAGSASNGLAVRDDGGRNAEGNSGVVLLEILETNLEMELSRTGDNVLTRLGNVSEDAGVGFRKTLKTLDELGQVGGVLDLNGDLDDRRNRKLHYFQVVGGLQGGESARLEQELIDTDQTANVAGRDIINRLDVSADVSKRE